MLAGLAGLSGAAAGAFVARYEWLLLLLSAGFLGYANFLVLVRHEGSRRTRLAVVAMTTFSLLIWLYDFLRHGG